LDLFGGQGVLYDTVDAIELRALAADLEE